MEQVPEKDTKRWIFGHTKKNKQNLRFGNGNMEQLTIWFQILIKAAMNSLEINIYNKKNVETLKIHNRYTIKKHRIFQGKMNM